MTIKPASDPQSPGEARGGRAFPGGSGETGPPAEASQQGPGPIRDGDVTSATFGYLGAIVLGPVIPLAVYAFRARRSPFMRYHAATAVNLSLTGVLYGLSCLILAGLLLLDSISVALIVMIPVALAIWVSMLIYLIRGVVAANRGEEYEPASWICARIVNPGRP
jgi:uncharacterized Tic20 family protein